MAVKAVAQVLGLGTSALASTTELKLHVGVSVPVSLGPFTSDPEGSLDITLDPSGSSVGNNQAIRDAVKAWVVENFPTIVWVNGTDTVRLLGSF